MQRLMFHRLHGLASLALAAALAALPVWCGAATTVNPAAAAPAVTLSAPGVAGAVTPGAKVRFVVTLSGITSVRTARLYDGATVVDTEGMAPWEFTVRAITAGAHPYRAEVVTKTGATYASPILTIVAGTVANKPPTVSILTPANNAAVALGTPVSLTANASDPDGTIARVEYWRGTTLLGSATASPFRFDYTAPAAAAYSIVAKAFDNAGASTTSAPVAFTVTTPTTGQGDDGVRLLMQATFGPTTADIARVRQLGISGWLDDQFAKPLTYSHVQYLNQVKQLTGMDAQEQHAYEAIWQNYLFGADQLRARVAFALSEIMVISNIAPDQDTYALASWMDMLYRNAFGNFRTLLGDVTLHPAMGYYLNMLGNDRENLAEGFHPNENYGRETMQLFTIGLVKLNLDGTPQRDGQGKTIPTYDQSVVEGFAAAFTGWNFAGNDTTSDDEFYWPPVENWTSPMAAWPARHSPGTKKLLDGLLLPAGQTPQADLNAALNSLFNHPNVGPFISRRLIQFLVTSNPTPGYVSRVATIFNNNGSGVRGDLRAVVRAILTDSEARDLTLAAQPTFGKLREPVIRFTHLLRATGAVAANGRNSVWWLDSPEDGLGQSPLLAPSVFNFFSPFFARGGAIAQAGLVSPEFQIHTETQVVGSGNLFADMLWNGNFGFDDTGLLVMNFAPWTALAGDANALVSQLALVFTANSMSATTRATLTKAVNAVPATDRQERVRTALTLLMVAPDYVVQH
jgi:uncharacterized protein (DUF1800 family)